MEVDTLETAKQPAGTRLRDWMGFHNRENQLLMVLSLIIGVIVGLTTVAFILLTGRLAARMYPPDSAAWRRKVLVPTAGGSDQRLSSFSLFSKTRAGAEFPRRSLPCSSATVLFPLKRQ